MPKLLQINFSYTIPTGDLGEMFAPAVKPIAEAKGLHWKIWLIDEKERTAGGIYLFEDDASVRAYLDGPIVAQLASSPAFTNMSARVSDVLAGPTAATRGPV